MLLEEWSSSPLELGGKRSGMLVLSSNLGRVWNPGEGALLVLVSTSGDTIRVRGEDWSPGREGRLMVVQLTWLKASIQEKRAIWNSFSKKKKLANISTM